MVEPVVNTSSTKKTIFPSISEGFFVSKAFSIFFRRSSFVRLVWLLVFLVFTRIFVFKGMLRASDSSFEIISDWLKPRSLVLLLWSGIGMKTEFSPVCWKI